MKGRGRSFDVSCTVRVAHTREDLSAHVELEEPIELRPGDRVLVHGPELSPPYGEVKTERRRATITRATWLQRIVARLVGELECLSLLDVSFSNRRTL